MQQWEKTPTWAKELKSVGKYYFSGVIDDLDSCTDAILCKFGKRTSVLKCQDGSSVGDNENLVINDSEDNSQVW